MEYIYIQRRGDTETITESINGFATISNESLIDDYNKQFKCGITGVHAQALYLMAMGHVFLKRFGKSPIYMEDNVLGMRDQIKLSGDTFEYVDKTDDKPLVEEPIKIIPPRDHLDPLIIEGSTNRLHINCDATNGIIDIKGRIISSEGLTFYEPLLKWVLDFAEMPPKPTSVSIKLEYFNTSGSVRLYDIFKRLEGMNRRNNQIVIYWYYEEGEKDMLENGKDFAKIINVPFKMISYSLDEFDQL
jgi:hypothetical protein